MDHALTSPCGETPDVRRIERFQALSAGQYWRARVADAKQHVDEGEVLLVESLRWVDEAVHTVVLRAHPLKYGRKMEGRWDVLTEHRFLLKDFLAQFEFEPDASRIRAGEVGQVQARIAGLQGELLQAQRDPALLAQVVAEELVRPQLGKADAQPSAKDEQAAESPAREIVEASPLQGAAEIGAITVGQAVAGGLSEQGVAKLRAGAEREYQVATIKAKWIEAKTTAIAEAVSAMTPFYSEQAAAALAATEDVRTYVGDLLRGIESLDLYVGKGVEVQTLREGAPAEADVPLTFVQKKLLMDEELAVWADIDQEFDFQSDELFVQAIHEQQGLVEQIFPTPRCIVVMATTHRHIDYGHPLANMAAETENRKVFLLVRNGDNVHRVYSPVESHLRSARLFPTKSEHEGIFKGLDGTTIRFEDISYSDRMAEHELFALHYRRFLILACGLDHRLGLFGKFYPGEPSMAFLSMPFQETYCRFLYDDDASTQIAGPSSKPSLAEWIEAKNAFLQSGSRVLCNWGSLLTPDSAPGVCVGRNYRSHRKADVLEGPAIKIAYKDGKDLCVEVAARREGRHDGARNFSARVSLSAHKAHSWDGVSDEMAYLVLDTVGVEDLRWYIHHRPARVNQVLYIRLFKRALAFLEQEALRQSPAKDKLLQALIEGGVTSSKDLEQAKTLVEQAVLAWRAAHRGRELPRLDDLATDSKEKAAWTALLDQMFALARQGSAPVQAAEQMARDRGQEPIALAITGKGKHVLYLRPQPDDQDDRGQPFAWVQRVTLEVGKRGKARAASASWVRLRKDVASETVLHVWSEQVLERSVEAGAKSLAFKSPEHKKTVFGSLLHWPEVGQAWREKLDASEFERRFAHYRAHRRECLQVTAPIGLVVSDKEAWQLCVQADMGFLLGRLAPDDAARARVRRAHAGLFVHEDLHARQFDQRMLDTSPWSLQLLRLNERAMADVLREEASISVARSRPLDPLLSTALESFAQSERGKRDTLVLAPGLTESLAALDQTFEVRRPADYCPTTVVIRSLYDPHHDGIAAVIVDVSAREASSDEAEDTEDADLQCMSKQLGCSGFGSTQASYETLARARAALPALLAETRYRNMGPMLAAATCPEYPQPKSSRVERYFLFRKEG